MKSRHNQEKLEEGLGNGKELWSINKRYDLCSIREDGVIISTWHPGHYQSRLEWIQEHALEDATSSTLRSAQEVCKMLCDKCQGPLYFVGRDAHGVMWYKCAVCSERYQKEV